VLELDDHRTPAAAGERECREQDRDSFHHLIVDAPRGAPQTAPVAVVRVALPQRAYDVLIEPGSLERLGEQVRAGAPHARCALVADSAVAPLWGAAARAALERAGYDVVRVELPSGESHKTLATVARVYDALLAAKLERGAPLIALGGGVTGDLAGFAATTYLRGIPLVQVPTTLLAMVDSSVGGKVGVNVPQGKNLIGAFWQPVRVVIDPLLLRTLPARELRCGLAECIKHGVIRDASLFEFIAARIEALAALDPAALVELVRRNVAIKAAVVVEDETETGVRAHLNFGHTFGHAIEATVGYGEILHGEAVALGMIAASVLAARIGLCGAELPERVRALVAAAGLPVRAALPADEVLEAAMGHDKKVAAGRVRFVLPEAIGRVAIRDDVPSEQVRSAWTAIRAA
jgi:3-dehydroquinate synthase